VSVVGRLVMSWRQSISLTSFVGLLLTAMGACVVRRANFERVFIDGEEASPSKRHRC
jgi:hypothetical protein